MIEVGLVALLHSSPTITSLVATRVYPVMVPANSLFPCLSFHTTSKPPDVSLDRTAMESKRVQIDCWAANYSDVKSLQAALHALLDGYTGTLSDGTYVVACNRSIESDYYESDLQMYRVMTEYTLVYAG